jgi:hypothetical protein
MPDKSQGRFDAALNAMLEPWWGLRRPFIAPAFHLRAVSFIAGGLSDGAQTFSLE